MANLTTTRENVRLLEFKEFLQQIQAELRGSGGSTAGVELRNSVARNNSDSYGVTIEELDAEIRYTLWQQLIAKNCPAYFQLPLLKTIHKEVKQTLHNTKDGNDVIINAKQSDDGMEGNKQYHLLKLQKLAKEELDSFLAKLCDNVHLEELHNYIENATLTKADEETLSDHPTAIAASIKNKQRKMEDRHVLLERYNELHELDALGAYKFYGVFDGHSGALAATYAATNLPYVLAQQLREFVLDNHVPDAYREALEAAFLQTDKQFAQKSIGSGTTAVCALLHKPPSATTGNKTNWHLYLAWVGDSKALLVSPRASIQLVKPHKPDSSEERKRIESTETGGAVMFVQGQWRVNGILNVSRSIGDSTVSAVIAEPDFVDVVITPTQDFLILATDGLWDHVAEHIIVQTIYQALADDKQQLDDIPKLLIELAKDGDSQDNITVVIVLFKERAQILENHKRITKT